MNHIIKDFCDYYQDLTQESLSQLDEIYTNDAEFIDPLHTIQGLKNITNYFENMVGNTIYCRFDIEAVLEGEGEAFVTWVMHFAHPKLNNGKNISVPGSSHLKFNYAICYHRDYYDMGQMIYEQIPLLKTLIAKIKNRISV